MKKINIQKCVELESSGKRPKGYVDTLRRVAHRESSNHFWIDYEAYSKLWNLHQPGILIEVKIQREREGPGTFLGRVAKFFRVPESAGCGCKSMKKKMNHWGWKGSLVHSPEIFNHLLKRIL